MVGREAAAKSFSCAALRFHYGQPMIYSTIAEKMYVQTNSSLVKPIFEEVTWDFEDCLQRDDWEPLEEPLTN